jgi:hypothetical protein
VKTDRGSNIREEYHTKEAKKKLKLKALYMEVQQCGT